jgi:TPR repeat protein
MGFVRRAAIRLGGRGGPKGVPFRAAPFRFLRNAARRSSGGAHDAETLYARGAALAHAAQGGRDRRTAEHLLREAAESGHGRACYALALFLASQRRHGEAVPWLERASALGVPEAAGQVASFELLAGTPKDPAVPELAVPPAHLSGADRLLWGKAQRGDAAAMAELGFVLVRSAKHGEAGRQWLTEAAERGHHEALYDLAVAALARGADEEAGYWALRASARRVVRAAELLRTLLPHLTALAARDALDLETHRLYNDYRAENPSVPGPSALAVAPSPPTAAAPVAAAGA